MTLPSPIAHPGSESIPWGSARVVGAFDAPAVEYAALRKGAGIIDRPERGVVEVTGADRAGFLERVLTQKLAGVAPWSSRASFWLNRKGRIDADLRVLVLPDRVRLEFDAESRDRVIEGLGGFIIAEEVAIRDASNDLHRIGIHGPGAASILASVLGAPTHGAAIESLSPGELASVRDGTILVERDDATGRAGFELHIERGSAAPLWSALVDAGAVPTGWYAFNTARIEAGRPMYNIDFGPASLPGETGISNDRVHLAKGCYLGQEVVARMANLGHPKQYLVALRGESPIADTPDARSPQPISGSAVRRARDDADPAGAVTSATISPMLGGVPIGFAAIRHPRPEHGSLVWVECNDDRTRIPMRVQAGLAFWPARPER